MFKAALAYEKAVGGWYTDKGKRPALPGNVTQRKARRWLNWVEPGRGWAI